MIWLYSQRQFGLAKTDEYVGRFSDIFDILARHEIGTQRLELGENNFSLPIEKHVILFILSDSSITIIPILINHRMWLAIFPRDRILTYKTLKPWPVFLDHYTLYKVAPDVVRAAIEITYQCLARQAHVLSLRKDQLRKLGIYIRQGKTEAKQIKEWSVRLRDAITRADFLPLQQGISSVYIIRQRTGLRYTRDSFNSRWCKTKEAAKEAHPELDFNFTFHDLKAKGVSDLEGSLSEKQAISGHKNMGKTARYDRKIKVVPVLGNQKK